MEREREKDMTLSEVLQFGKRTGCHKLTKAKYKTIKLHNSLGERKH